MKPKIAFATHTYYKDWRIVLNPKRFETILTSHKYNFDKILIIINNIFPKDKKKSIQYAEQLIKLGLATDIIIADEYLTKNVLADFNINYKFFWTNNPYFSTAQISALHYLKNKVDYILHMAGDVWLEKCGNWIPEAIKNLEKSENMIGFNLCRNIYLNEYPKWASNENEYFWISNKKLTKNGKRGFGLSDLAYVLKTNPKYPYDFGFDNKDFKKYYKFWPTYATPCFEMYIRAFLDKYKLTYGALKPINGIPITKHKNFNKFQLKNLIYLYLGYYYTNGKYGPSCK
jgi:hypothetical protein